VGKELEKPMTVLVRDGEGRPVLGAPVQFRVAAGGGTLIYSSINPTTGEEISGTSQDTAVVFTNSLGLASARLQTGTSTDLEPRYIVLARGDENLTKVGQNVIDVVVGSHGGAVTPSKPFIGVGIPDVPVALTRTNSCCFAGNLPDSAHDIINLQVTDQYQNPVSNASVVFVLTSTDGSPGTLYGNCYNCGIGQSLNIKTDPTGSSVTLVMGTASQYTLTGTYNLLTFSQDYSLNLNREIVFRITKYADSVGNIIAAA